MKRNAWIDASDLADVADEEPHDSYFRNTVLFNDALQVSSIHALVEPATGKDLVLAEDSLQASFVQRKRSEGPNATYGSREASQRRSSVLRLLLACQVAPPCQETLPSRSDTWPSQCRCYCLGHACTSHRLQDCRRLSLAIVACQLLRGDLQWTLCYHPVYFALRDAVSTGGFEIVAGNSRRGTGPLRPSDESKDSRSESLRSRQLEVVGVKRCDACWHWQPWIGWVSVTSRLTPRQAAVQCLPRHGRQATLAQDRLVAD
mmetsp:Transcript_60348/g.143796  ORF Transcript_60348/g.143796 Transcript_60348/m.143796 type:complete len:260 (-) Transcript_60348:6-785(-)